MTQTRLPWAAFPWPGAPAPPHVEDSAISSGYKQLGRLLSMFPLVMRQANQLLGAEALKATASRSKLEDADGPRGLGRRRFRWLARPAGRGARRRRKHLGAASARPAGRSGTPRSCLGWDAPGLFNCFYVPLFWMLDILTLTCDWHLIKADNVKTSTSLCDGLFNTKYCLLGNLILPA